MHATVTTPATGQHTRDVEGDVAGDRVRGDGACGVGADGVVRGLVDRLASVLSDDPATLAGMDPEVLAGRVGLLGRLEGVTAAAMAATVRALSESGQVGRDGAPSATAWLRTHTPVSARAAARTVRAASSLDVLPATRTALTAGAITVEAADAIVTAARRGQLGTPGQVDARFAPIAQRCAPEDLRAAIVEATRQADTAAGPADQARQHTRRRVSLHRGQDGMWRLSGRLPGEAGEATRTLLDLFDRPDPDGTPSGQRRRPDQRLADAFATAVTTALDLGDTPTAAGMARPHVNVHVELAALQADLSDPDRPDRPVTPDHPVWTRMPHATMAWGTRLSPQAARRLCCDATIARIITNGPSQILDVGRATRTWSGPQRRAINLRDGHCRGPACTRPLAWTHIHHLQWWRHGGPTNLTNGLALCHHCHRLIHDRGWHAQLDPTTAIVTWTTPDRHHTIITHPRPPC